MAKLLGRFFLFLLLVLPTTINFMNSGELFLLKSCILGGFYGVFLYGYVALRRVYEEREGRLKHRKHFF